MGTSGKPGQGLNIDTKPTCSPAEDCSNGIDNSLAPLHGFLNENLEKEVNKGGVILLFEMIDLKTNGQPFSIALYAGKRANKQCKHQSEVCNYLVEEEMLDEKCNPKILIDNATIKNGKLSAGGPGYSFTLYIPLFGDVLLPVTLYYGTVQGDIVMQGKKVVSIKNAIVGGAMPKSLFATALDYAPADDLPAPKETLVQLLDILIKNDMDTDGDGQADAVSLGLVMEAIGGNIVGVDD